MPFLISNELLERGSRIGQGHFGVVYKGTLYNKQAAVYCSVAVKSFGGKSSIVVIISLACVSLCVSADTLPDVELILAALLVESSVQSRV